MQKLGAIGLFFAAAVLSGNAYAADAVTDTAPPEAVFTAPAFTWTGFYAGVNAGYAFSGNDRVGFRERGNFLGSIGTLEDNGFLGGAQVGYNYQINNFVLGREADFQGGDISDSISGPLGRVNFDAHSKIDWFGTVRPRLGYAFDRTMIYGTGGLAYGNVKYSISDSIGNAASESKTRAGWVAGGCRGAMSAAAWGVPLGLAVFAVWILPEQFDLGWYRRFCIVGEGGTQAIAGTGAALLAARLAGSAFVISAAEELFFRRWLAGFAGFWWTVGLFAVEHDRWLVGAVAGIAYGLICMRKGLGAAVVAHATTNLALGAWVLCSGQWQFW